MYELETSRVISCAHRLIGYQGECCNLHGHNYRITVVLRAEELDRIGIAFDFKKLKYKYMDIVKSPTTGLFTFFVSTYPLLCYDN